MGTRFWREADTMSEPSFPWAVPKANEWARRSNPFPQ
jgi:hypothetical protein